MPHKHKRRQNDETTFNLPPSELAKPLPVRDPKLKKGGPGKNKQTQQKKQPDERSENTKKSKKSKSQRQNDLADDTPKAFRRLMQFQTTGQRTPSGLDTGKKQQRQQQNKDNAQGTEGNNKKRKREDTKNEADNNKTKDTESAQEMPKILPGEKLSDFAARVDRTLPLSAMKKSTAPGVGKMREDRQTRHEKHLRRLQKGWREEEARIREREQAEREERETEMEDELRLWKEWETEAGAGKAKKKAAAAAAGKKKKKGRNDETGGHVSDDDDPDPWAKLKKRDRERKANPFDVAQAPPQLTKPREIFKVRGGAKVDVANVPAAVGSLRRREELAGERRTIVEEYRRLMAEKRG